MQLNEVTLENFYSVEKQTINLDQLTGLVLVEGINKDSGGSNGAGKSIIFEAIVWALFGKTIRKSTEDAMVNIKNGKNCRVTLRVNGTTIIRRSRKPTKLEFIKDGNPLTQANAAATQEAIEADLNLNYKVFMASIVFGQHSDMDFLGATPDDKRLIIKNFLNLDEIFKYRDAIKEKKSDYNNEVKSLDGAINELTKLITSNKNKLSKYDGVELPDWIKNYTIEDVIKENNEYEFRKTELSKNKKEIDLCKELIQESKTGVETCSECGQVIREARFYENSQIDEWVEKVNRLTELVNIPIPKPKLTLSEFSTYSKKIELIKEKDAILSSIQEMEVSKNELFIKKKFAERNYEVMRFWEKAFSEQGLIKYIIRTILEKFNKTCNKYLTHLSNGQFTITFNDELNETIKVNGFETHYISLSGGEKKKLNFSVMLALRSLLSLSGKSVSNVLLLDEIVENLDEQSLHGVYIILSELKKDKNVFLVTHNSYFKTLLDSSNRLTAIKDKGITEFKYGKHLRV
jgi:DNA repair exonuclease SbcCD ATPase subunit